MAVLLLIDILKFFIHSVGTYGVKSNVFKVNLYYLYYIISHIF